MRITDAMRLNDVMAAESRASERMNQLSQMAASGVRVAQPSDDPAAYASIVQRDAQMATVQARSSAATSAAGDLDTAGSALDQVTVLLQQARSIAVEQANGTIDAATRKNASIQVDSLVQQLASLANSRGSSGYLFGGTKTAAPPFDSSGNYSGDGGVTHVEVADNVLAVSNANGQQAFSAPGGRNVFADLQSLSTALSANDPAAIQATIASLDASHAQVVAAEVTTGEQSARLHSAGDVMSAALTQIQTGRAAVADADMASTVSNLQQAQTAYQAALQVNKQILSLASAQSGG
jgi:flagellar hook-associated protein 3 FlgL